MTRSTCMHCGWRPLPPEPRGDDPYSCDRCAQAVPDPPCEGRRKVPIEMGVGRVASMLSDEPMHISDIAERLGLTVAQVSRLIAEAVRRGVAVRVGSCGRDGYGYRSAR